MLFKKDFPPKEAELAAYRRGESWDDDKELENIRQEQQQHQQQVVQLLCSSVAMQLLLYTLKLIPGTYQERGRDVKATCQACL